MKPLTDLDPMPFGKHKGVPMQDVPASYLHYLWSNGMKNDKTGPVADYIRRGYGGWLTPNSDGGLR